MPGRRGRRSSSCGSGNSWRAYPHLPFDSEIIREFSRAHIVEKMTAAAPEVEDLRVPVSGQEAAVQAIIEGQGVGEVGGIHRVQGSEVPAVAPSQIRHGGR